MLTFTVSRRQAWIVALIVLMGAIGFVGQDRARAGFIPPGEGIDVAYVAVSTNFPDALGVGPGAGVNAGPIILVPTDPPIPGFTQTELVRLDPQKVVIVGGTGVVSQAMEDAIAALLPNATIERLAGSNRYETNTLFTQSVYPVTAWASVPPMAFTGGTPATDTVDIDISGASNATDGELFAPIHLPDGARILELRISGMDTDAGQSLYVDLERVNDLGVGNSIVFISVPAAFAFGGFVDTETSVAPAYALVDNQNFGYFVHVTNADGDPSIVNVSVLYQLGTPGA